MQNYKTRIAQAKSSFELSCIWEEVRSKKMYEKRSAEIAARRKSL